MDVQRHYLGISVAPWVNSGYGHQAGNLWPRIAASGRPTAVYAYRGAPFGQVVSWPDQPTDDGKRFPVTVYPQGRISQFGWEQIPFYYRMHQADVILSLCNLFVFDEIKRIIASEGWPWWHWTPVDTSPLGAPDYNLLNITGIRPIAMSRFGQQQLINEGFEDVPYVPHSIDTALFRPPSADEYRQARQDIGIDEDIFLVTINANNESAADRKAFTQNLCAFQAFHARHPNTRLYIHAIAYRHPVGLDLKSQLVRLGIYDGTVIFPHEQTYNSGMISYEELRNRIYWPSQIALQATKGEGFGIPILEAQACGLPVIVSNNSTGPELAAPGEFGGMKIPCQKEWSTLDSSYWGTPLIDHIEDALELMFLCWRRDEMEPCRHAARTHTLGYDHQVVWDSHWVPLLDRIDKEAG